MNDSPKAEKPRQVEPFALDVIPPARIARLAEEVGIKKCSLPLIPTLTLDVLAGAFIAFGGMFYTLVVTGSELGFGPTRLVGGLAFSTLFTLVLTPLVFSAAIELSVKVRGLLGRSPVAGAGGEPAMNGKG